VPAMSMTLRKVRNAATASAACWLQATPVAHQLAKCSQFQPPSE
jgi:hypothetical protein